MRALIVIFFFNFETKPGSELENYYHHQNRLISGGKNNNIDLLDFKSKFCKFFTKKSMNI